MTLRRPGMDHDLYGYSPLPMRPRLEWSNGAHLAACVILYLEYWELDPPADVARDRRFSDPSGYYFPDYRTYTWREYGNRVGIFRILDLLERHGLPATVAANAEACARYPELVDMLLERGYEFAAHGTHATRMLSSRMTPNEEQDAIAGAIEAVSKAAGVKPTGWISQDFGESTRTPFLVAEAGLSYIMDWANDDQPYAMKVGRPLISVPSQAEWDDVQLLWHRRVSLFRYAGIIEEAFTRLHEEGAQAGMYFGLHLHPWLMGAPQRIHQLEIALSRIASRKAVWWTTAGEVSRHFLSNPALLVPQPSR